MPRIKLPAADEHIPYYGKYITLVGDDVLGQLEALATSTPRLLAKAGPDQGDHRYEPGKWSVKEVVGHMADAERVFSYRALRIGRGDETALPGFEQDDYVVAGHFDRRTLADMAAEFAAVRAATLALFRSFDDEAILRRGTAAGGPVSVRALAAIIAGHELHHVGILKSRYGLKE